MKPNNRLRSNANSISSLQSVNSNSCSNCSKEYPANYEARYCPYCGAARPETLTPANSQSAANSPSASQKGMVDPIKINWWIIFGALFAPPLLTLLVAYLGRGVERGDPFSPGIGFFGGALGGIAFGVMLALRICRTTVNRWLLGILFAVIFAIVCITLSCFGCLAGGFNLRFG